MAFWGIIASSCLCITGIFGIVNAFQNRVTLDWIDADTFSQWTSEVNPLFSSSQHAIVLLLIGFISFLAEINFEWALHNFQVIATPFGHGCFYILSGFLTLGIAGNLGIVLGGTTGVIGVLYILYALLFGNRSRAEYVEV